MKKCRDCDKDADVTCDGLLFCMEHYHEWAATQNRAVFDWEAVN
jgi:hypothetical protein